MKNKYHSIAQDGYASKKEARHAAELKFMQKAGLISELKEQVKFELIPACKRDDGSMERAASYVADFTYIENNDLVVEDTKGMRLPLYILKRKLLLFMHGITIREI